MDKLLLVDGSNLLFQMFFGMPARIVNQEGKTIHAAMGFVGALNKIIRMIQPTHVAVLFDGEHENARTALNADYKANRVDYSAFTEEECPFTQLSDIYAALDFMKIKHAETSDCETDDWIAGYALAYGNDAQIVISSFDSDYFQLITGNVSVLRYHGKKSTICTPEYIVNHFFVSPAQYADYKSLVGDVSDNIKGAQKVGPKTASLLLNSYGTLENILAHAEQIERRSIRESILANMERLKTNYQLIKLTKEAVLPFSLDEIAYSGSPFSTTEILKAIRLLP